MQLNQINQLIFILLQSINQQIRSMQVDQNQKETWSIQSCLPPPSLLGPKFKQNLNKV